LQSGLDNYLNKIFAVRAFYDASYEVDRDAFNLFTDQITPGRRNYSAGLVATLAW